MWGGPLARVDGGADVLGRGDILHGEKGMDRDAARRTGRVRILLLRRHVIAREDTRRRGGGQRCDERTGRVIRGKGK